MKTHTHKTRILGAMLAFAGSFGLALGAQAAETTAAANHRDIVVQYADLNVSTAAGVKALYARLSAASERACGFAPKTRDLGTNLSYKACYESTLNRAVDKVRSEPLQALHASRVEATFG